MGVGAGEERREEEGKRERRGVKGRLLLSQPPAVGNLSHLGHPSPSGAPDIVKQREEPLFCALFEFLTH